MRVPLAITALLMAVALGWGWRDHQQLSSLRDHQQQLVSQAAARGLPIDATESSKPQLPAKTQRTDRLTEAKQAATRLVAYSKEMKALGDALNSPDEKLQDRIILEVEQLEELDAEQWKIVINEILALPEEGWRRRELIIYALERLTLIDHPQGSLEILTGNPEMIADMQKTNGLFEGLVSTAIRRWATLNPAAAREWFARHESGLTPEAKEITRHVLIRGTAEKDPRLALRLIGELGESPQDFAAYIFPKATPEERSSSLALLREWSPTIADPSERSLAFAEALQSLVFDTTRARSATFGHSASWIDQAGLTAEEIDLLAKDLDNRIAHEDGLLWIEWLGKRASPERARPEAARIFEGQIKADYKAAAKWLETAAEGPAKQGAISAYAATVASKDPESAVRWALTLPEGKDRTETLEQIHNKWPRDTEAQSQAAEDFARQHGIK